MRTPFVRRGREEVEVEGVFTAPQRGQPQIGWLPDTIFSSFFHFTFNLLFSFLPGPVLFCHLGGTTAREKSANLNGNRSHPEL